MIQLLKIPMKFIKILNRQKALTNCNFFVTTCLTNVIFLEFRLKLKAFSKFENTTDALSAVTALVEGKAHLYEIRPTIYFVFVDI
jgi:hypothetical protein